jgi:hypothetical protein
MKKLLLAVLIFASCKTTPEVVHEPTPEPICLQPKEIVTVVKESCGVQVEFTPAVDQSVAGVVICVLDPSTKAMLCMTPKEAAARAALSGATP